MLKNIFKVIKIIFRNSICLIISFFIPRNKHYFAVGCHTENLDLFIHNTKYLFLYLNSKKLDVQCAWLTDDKKIINTLRKNGYQKIYKRSSIKGIWCALRSKYLLYDYSPTSICNPWLCYGAKKINLWHGIPLKKMGFDDINDKRYYFNKLQKFFYTFLSITYKSNYITNSECETILLSSCFGTNKKYFKILGSPRLDVLFHDIPHSDLFMKEDFAAIKEFKNIGKHIIIYMPTFRDSGKDISGWLKSDKLKQFLKNNNAVLVCKLHPFDKNSLDFELSEEFYKMDSESDIYPVLKYSDAIITDYSSIAYDYLLLDKPIIYHVPDLEEYQEKCRGFYIPYSEFAVGEVTRSEDEIISAMQNVINGIDNFKDERKVLRDKMFKYQDGRNCERVVEWIKSLNEKK